MNELIGHIQYLIRRQDKVEVPNFGTMYGVVLPPFFNERGDLLLAPTRKIYWENTTEGQEYNNSIVGSYCLKYNISEDQARVRIENDVRDIKSNLRKNGMVIAGRLGQFFQKRDSIDFVPNRNSEAYNPYTVYTDYKKKQQSKGWGLKLKSMAIISGIVAYTSCLCSIIS